ncbi:hypothetical protein BBJ29_004070 [Phytophthora kernoviae]|uniref:UDP-glycosyltransferases domain-containing protein n=1 Tax=Phytophthora kernoviae TaxID=325452 RepID=A0A3F2RJL5_9STRA|nr:hypothetical protein BBP00_00007481 [Phytophthora kernoviae]RLN60036.1 hypothetical protein BBJ29_004070 [Phytophthora kernoviae]
MTRDASNFRGILTMFNDIYVRAARPMFDALLPQLDKNGSNSNAPDLVVLDIATVGAQDLAHKLKVPYILNSPSLLFDLGGAPSYVPAWGTGFSENMSLWNRCMNILFPRLLSVALTPPFMELNKMRYELDLPPFRSQHDLFKGARVILNTAFGLEHAQPLSPLVDAVGPIMPMAGVKVLWVLPTDQRGILPSVLPASLVVKPPSSSLSNLEVLSHPAVRLVISHCGMVSAQEALVMGKPLICIPFLVDQPDVAARVADSGAGVTLDKNLLTGSYVRAAVMELLTNTTYTRAARRVGSLLERAGGTSRAVDVIDAALRLGFDHLDTMDLTAPWHKTAMLDVWTVYAAVICLLAVFVRVLWLLFYFIVSESFSFLCSIVLGPSLPPSSIGEGYEETYEDGDEGEGGSSDASQSTS